MDSPRPSKYLKRPHPISRKDSYAERYLRKEVKEGRMTEAEWLTWKNRHNSGNWTTIFNK